MNQPTGSKLFNMMRYGGKGNVKFFSHRAHGEAVVCIQSTATMARTYLLEDCHSVLIGQCLKGFYHPFTVLRLRFFSLLRHIFPLVQRILYFYKCRNIEETINLILSLVKFFLDKLGTLLTKLNNFPFPSILFLRSKNVSRKKMSFALRII